MGKTAYTEPEIKVEYKQENGDIDTSTEETYCYNHGWFLLCNFGFITKHKFG